MAITSHFHEWDVRRGSPGQGLCLGLAAAGALRLVMGGCMQMVIKIEKGRGAGYSSACIAALSLYVCLSLPPLAPFLHKCKSLRIRQDLPVKHHNIVSSYGKEGRCISHGSALCDEHAELCINRQVRVREAVRLQMKHVPVSQTVPTNVRSCPLTAKAEIHSRKS